MTFIKMAYLAVALTQEVVLNLNLPRLNLLPLYAVKFIVINSITYNFQPIPYLAAFT